MESPSNEAKSEIQRCLDMTDELNNHATIMLERNDLDEVAEPADRDLTRNFTDATKISDRKVALHELYKEELAYQESLQCRGAFFNLLAYGYKTFESIAEDMDMSAENFAQLQGLIFNEMRENNYQSDKNNDKNLMRVTRKKIKKTYTLFFNSTEFE